MLRLVELNLYRNFIIKWDGWNVPREMIANTIGIIIFLQQTLQLNNVMETFYYHYDMFSSSRSNGKWKQDKNFKRKIEKFLA